jgi:hypothetical protein
MIDCPGEGWFIVHGVTAVFSKGDGWTTDDDMEFTCERQARDRRGDQARMNRNTKTFIGPITEESRAGHRTAYFMILQAGSGVIKLEYPDKTEAGKARGQLLQSNHSFKVPSNKLLQAIYEALLEAIGGTPKEDD